MSSMNRVTLTTYLKWGKDNVLSKKLLRKMELNFL